MADRKQLMNDPGAFSVAEIAEAVRAGIVSLYELSKSGKLTPLMRRRIENELRKPAAAQQPMPVPDYTPTPAEPTVAPMPEQPAYQQPAAPSQPIVPPQPVQPVVQPMQPTYQPPTIAPAQPVAPVYEEPTTPQPVQPIAPPQPVVSQPVVPTPPPLPVATEPQQPTYPQQPVDPSPLYPAQPPFPGPVPQPQAPRKLPRLLSFQGRETRTNYFLISLCVNIFCFMLVSAIAAILDTYRVSGGEIAGAIVCMLIIFFLYWIVWAAAVRRCHDMGKSGWFVLLSLIPIANIVVGLMLLFCSGDPGENEYGPNPR